ncbi:MAG: hypothetical protein HZB26_10225 [Candidatus Hydrogenedentes bacterium]|nr:hypothetical protein [Candidatus Hydrogenedentota bacterium]
MSEPPDALDPVGLCARCAHARQIHHPHGGAAYWRCGVSDADPKYPKYPRLPVVTCAGFEQSRSGPDSDYGSAESRDT